MSREPRRTLRNSLLHRAPTCRPSPRLAGRRSPSHGRRGACVRSCPWAPPYPCASSPRVKGRTPFRHAEVVRVGCAPIHPVQIAGWPFPDCCCRSASRHPLPSCRRASKSTPPPPPPQLPVHPPRRGAQRRARTPRSPTQSLRTRSKSPWRAISFCNRSPFMCPLPTARFCSSAPYPHSQQSGVRRAWSEASRGS